MPTIKDDEMARLIESAEVILRGLTDAVREIDAGRTADARLALGHVSSQVAGLKSVLQAYKISGRKPAP